LSLFCRASCCSSFFPLFYFKRKYGVVGISAIGIKIKLLRGGAYADKNKKIPSAQLTGFFGIE
jgi:hypothetical protein